MESCRFCVRLPPAGRVELTDVTRDDLAKAAGMVHVAHLSCRECGQIWAIWWDPDDGTVLSHVADLRDHLAEHQVTQRQR